MDTQISLVVSSIFGLMTAFALASIVLLISTRSLVVATISIVSIVGIVSVVLGVMVMMGRELGFMESICVTVIVGLAVDYVVHIGIAYTEHFHDYDAAAAGGAAITPSPVRHLAMRGAMTDLGVSVLGGATSSFGSALFLLMCVIKYLNQFGEFMALVIITSLLFSSIIYPGMLAAMGDMTMELRWKRHCALICCIRGGGVSRRFGDKRSSAEVSAEMTNEVEQSDVELSSQEIMNWSKQPEGNEVGGNDSS